MWKLGCVREREGRNINKKQKKIPPHSLFQLHKNPLTLTHTLTLTHACSTAEECTKTNTHPFSRRAFCKKREYFYQLLSLSLSLSPSLTVFDNSHVRGKERERVGIFSEEGEGERGGEGSRRGEEEREDLLSV